MFIIKNEDFKIVKGKDKLNFTNFTQMLRNTIFVQYVEFTLITIQDQTLQ